MSESGFLGAQEQLQNSQIDSVTSPMSAASPFGGEAAGGGNAQGHR